MGKIHAFFFFFPPSLLGQCGEDQLYFWVLGIHVSLLSVLAVEQCVQYVRVSSTEVWWGGILALDPGWELFLGKETSRQNRGGKHLFCTACSVPADAKPIYWVLS